MPWTIEYENDTGPSDEGFSEWWTVSSGNPGRSYRAYSGADAQWLVMALKQRDEWMPPIPQVSY